MVVKSDKKAEITKDSIIIATLSPKRPTRAVIKIGNRFANNV